MKSAIKILKERLKPHWMFGGDSEKAVIAAMEEYAQQFKSSPAVAEEVDVKSKQDDYNDGEWKAKVLFYREQMQHIRKYCEVNNIGKPSQSLFDAIFEHLNTALPIEHTTKQDAVVAGAVKQTVWIEREIKTYGLPLDKGVYHAIVNGYMLDMYFDGKEFDNKEEGYKTPTHWLEKSRAASVPVVAGKGEEIDTLKRFSSLYEQAAIDRDNYKDNLIGFAMFCGSGFWFNNGDSDLWESFNDGEKFEVNGQMQFRFTTQELYQVYQSQLNIEK